MKKMFKKHQKILQDCGLLLANKHMSLRKFWLIKDKRFANLNSSNLIEFNEGASAAQFQCVLRDDNNVSVVALGTNLHLDIWDVESPTLKLYKKNSNLNQAWIVDNEQCTIQSAANATVLLQIAFVPYTILSMNVAYYVVQNQRSDASEDWFVELCQKTYQKTQGSSEIPLLSQCTKNVMDMIVSCTKEPFDLIGFQEMSSDVPVKYLIDSLRHQQWEYFFAQSDGFLLSNVRTMGQGKQFTKKGQQTLNTTQERAFCGVWFADVATVAISMHAGHGYDKNLVKELEQFLDKTIAAQFISKCGEISLIKSVVLMGDFNYDVTGEVIHAFGKVLRVNASKKVTTCCQNKRAIDFIFTSDATIPSPTPVYFGLPFCNSNYTKKISGTEYVLQSDHLAVVSGLKSVFK